MVNKSNKRRLRVSIVIPVYNEARHIAACLDAIAAQIEPFDEVIVVDNNSTDNTAEIAGRYPFVTLLHEKTQGSVPARNTGFEAATGDILGRINCDVRVSPNWAARVRQQFTDEPSLGGLSGLAVTGTLPRISFPSTTLWSRIYYLSGETYYRLPQLWGATMAVRRSAWEEIKAEACPNNVEVHEDQDLSLLLGAHGWPAKVDTKLRVYTGGQDYHRWPQLSEYLKRNGLTKRRHQNMGTFQKAGSLLIPLRRTIPLQIIIGLPVGIFIAVSFLMGLPGIMWRAARRLFN